MGTRREMERPVPGWTRQTKAVYWSHLFFRVASGVQEPPQSEETQRAGIGSSLAMSVREEVRHYIVENILFGDGDKLDDQASFQETGIVDSTGFLELIAFIEEKFDMTMTDEELVPENFDSVERIATFVQQKRDGAGA